MQGVGTKVVENCFLGICFSFIAARNGAEVGTEPHMAYAGIGDYIVSFILVYGFPAN